MSNGPKLTAESQILYSYLVSRDYSTFVSQAADEGKNVGVLLLYCNGDTNKQHPELQGILVGKGVDYVSVSNMGGIIGINLLDEDSASPIISIEQEMRDYLAKNYPQNKFTVSSTKTTEENLETVLRNLSKSS